MKTIYVPKSGLLTNEITFGTTTNSAYTGCFQNKSTTKWTKRTSSIKQHLEEIFEMKVIQSYISFSKYHNYYNQIKIVLSLHIVGTISKTCYKGPVENIRR